VPDEPGILFLDKPFDISILKTLVDAITEEMSDGSRRG